MSRKVRRVAEILNLEIILQLESNMPDSLHQVMNVVSQIMLLILYSTTILLTQSVMTTVLSELLFIHFAPHVKNVMKQVISQATKTICLVLGHYSQLKI